MFEDFLAQAYLVAQFLAAAAATAAAWIANCIRARQDQHQKWELEQLRALARAIADARTGAPEGDEEPPRPRRRRSQPSPDDGPPVPPQDAKAALRASLIAQREGR